MSVKAAIHSVKVQGVPVYLGVRSGTDSFSANPDTVMNWLCDGWRTRFNQHRSRRQKYVKATLPDGESRRVLIPIGSRIDDFTDAQAREGFSHLSAIPSLVIQSTERVENTEWFAAVKRRKTLIAKGKNGGAMPRFRSFKRHDQSFLCWFNGGRNAVFQRTGKRTGTVTITGRNPVSHPKHKGRSWKVVIRVRTRQDVPEYTSVSVNWSRKTLVFTAAPKKVELSADASMDALGVDRGKLYAASDGRILTVPEAVADDEKKIRLARRTVGKMVSRAKKGGVSAKELWKISRRYRDARAALSEVCAHQAAVRNAWLHEITTELARDNMFIALESLNIQSMTRRGKSRKKAMNRVFLNAAPATFENMLTYKHAGTLAKVPAAYTSQRCHNCGHTCKENRESQAVFRCVKCGHTDNADVNASKNTALVALVGLGAVDAASLDAGVVVIPKLSTESFVDLYGQQTVDRVRTRQTSRNACHLP